MFINDYVLPAISLIRSNQKVILHNIILLVATVFLALLGLLIALIPTVAGFTLEGVPMASLEISQVQTLLMTKTMVQAGLVLTVILLIIKEIFISTFYLGGLINNIIEPQDTIGDAVKLAFSAIKKGFLPAFSVFLGIVVIAAVFGGIGAAGWFILKIPMLTYSSIGLGGLLLAFFCFFSSLTLWAAIMEEAGPVECISISFNAIKKELANYLGLFLTLLLVNGVILAVPAFGIFVSLITIPISAASLAGFLYLNKKKTFDETGTIEKKVSEPQTKLEKETSESEKTKESLDKILKQI